MTAAYRFRGVGWFLSGVIVVLGSYLVSLQVATERQKVAEVSRAIALAKRDIRSLETEFNTRANLAQLERWNGEVLALTAPNADQFVRDEAALAQVNFERPDGAPRTEAVAMIVPAMPGAAGAAPVVVATPAPATVPHVAPAVRTIPAPATAKPALARTMLASVAPVPARAGAPNRAPHRTQAVAMLDRSLLSDSTVGDLIDGARAEAGHLR